MGFLRKKVGPELTMQRNWSYKHKFSKLLQKPEKIKLENYYFYYFYSFK